MVSKYEYELQMQEEREKRSGNIERLQKLLTEARELRAAIPQDHSDLEAIKDRDFLQRRVLWLEELLKDEQRAYNSTFQPNEADTKAFKSALN
jgi:hypothetical protein